MKQYSHKQYDALMDKLTEEMKKLASVKGGEYSGDNDRLANFRRNAANLGVPMELIWAVYAAKHWDAIMQYVQDLVSGKTRPRNETIGGRAHDLLVYLTLFCAMLEEQDNERETVKSPRLDQYEMTIPNKWVP